MADDSLPWKDELIRVSERLEAKTKQTRWTNRTDYLIERDFVIGAYAMRWLIESNQVSTKTRRRQIPVRRFDSSARLPRTLGDIGVSYEVDHSRRDALSVAHLCHEILHNSVFTLSCGETADLFDGIYVSSNREGNEFVYLVLASDFIALCSDIGEENV